MPELPVQPVRNPGTAGVNITYRTSGSSTDPLDTANMFTFQNDGRSVVLAKLGGSSANITVHANKQIDGLALPDRAVVLTSNRDRIIGPFDPDVYNNDDGEVELEFSAVANLSIAVLRL